VSSRADSGWEQFAAREPYFAAVTDPRFLRANLTPQHEREFFASGEALVAWMLATIDAALVPQFAPMSTLEYGCGPGRLALPLGARPGRVVAVDRSDAMLRIARGHAERRGLDVVFQRPGDFVAQPRRFDLVVCYHVMQRLPRLDALALLRRLQAAIGPDGVGVFQWCCGSREPLHVDASRWVRERVPGVNALANRLRGKPVGDPFVPTHVYGVEEMLREFAAAGLDPVHVSVERHGTIDYAIAFAHRGTRSRLTSAPHGEAPRSTADATPARTGAAASTSEIGGAELAEWNRAAEAYFASLTTWDHHLAKPFSQMEETPTLLAGVAVLLQSLRLAQGMTVLEFGAGTGWLSRFLTQMGCRAILLDVSPTALRIAREHYARQPVIGDRPAPAFLEFDGRRIDLPDASVDRVICFDAFHHAPNPRAVIGEFGRVLRPGGIAGFVEPGPRHAEAPRSRFEAGTYGVVERDVDVHDIRRAALAHGFADLRMCVFHAPPYQVSLEEYEDLLAGGGEGARWLDSTRAFLRHVRSFSIIKRGQEHTDSRAMAGLACEIRAQVVAQAIDVYVTNTGTATWLPWGTGVGGVGLGAHLYDASGTLVSFDFHVDPLADPPRTIASGETVHRRVAFPPLPPGSYRVELDCVASQVTWFAQAGSKTVTLALQA
jgi:2-polyprenyl-3-methyl-5-hydroxy-6-metoxy-1,4-benzoquinol methylase